MRHAIIWASSAVMLICAAGASAAPPQLKGRYAVTGSATCLAAQKFDKTLLEPQLPPPNTSRAAFYSLANSVLATRTYNGDGTGSVEGRQVYIATPLPGGGNFTPSAGSNEFSFNFTYNIDANGIFTTAMVPGSFSGKFLTGTRTGQTFTADAVSFSGLVSGDNKIIDVATTTPEIETNTYSNGDVQQEICQRSRVHVFLGHSTDRDEKADGHNSNQPN
jgi:hypothetical protein